MTDSEPWTSLSIPMSTQMTFEWTFGYHVLCPFLCGTLQNPRRDVFVSSWVILMLTILVSSLAILFLFLVDMFRHTRDLLTYVWPDDDGCHHTVRALRISLHHRRSKSHSWATRSLVKLSDEPISCRYDHRVTGDVWATPKFIIR